MKFSIFNFPRTRTRFARSVRGRQFSKLGFSLFEVLIVVAIIIIVGGFSFAGFKSLQPSLKLRSAARDIIADLRYAQQLAVSEQVNHGVRFATSTEVYKIVRYGTTTEELTEKSLAGGVDFDEISGFSNNEVVFNPYGAAEAAGSISLINIEGETKTIEVKPSGFVKMQ